jgi:hypothetical protein
LPPQRRAIWPATSKTSSGELAKVAATNNACERALSPAVVQWKITNGYRAMRVVKGEADVRTVVDTARLATGTNPFKIILQTTSAEIRHD